MIDNRIVGGETHKTFGLRNNPDLDYEEQFARITALNEALAQYVVEGGPVMNTNDGPMAANILTRQISCRGPLHKKFQTGLAHVHRLRGHRQHLPLPAFAAAVEQAAGGGELDRGFFAHTLGTELGTGWVRPDGSIPEIPLEVYNFIIDLGSRAQRSFQAGDVRSVLNLNTGLPGTLQRYTSQSGVPRRAVSQTGQRGTAQRSQAEERTQSPARSRPDTPPPPGKYPHTPDLLPRPAP